MAENRSAEDGPTPRTTDLVLIALLLVYTVASLLLAGLPAGSNAGGIAVTLVTLAAVPLRRTRPRAALLVLAVPDAVGYALQWPAQALLWAVVAFALVRGPVKAGRLLAPAVLAVGAVSGAGVGLGAGEVAFGIGYGVSIAFQIGLYTLVGALLGLVSRSVRAREETRRRSEERARTAAVLAVQRTRIADELGSGVLDGLRRLVARTSTPDRDRTDVGAEEVAGLERDARDVLTRMRRTLAALRERDPAASVASPDLPDDGPRTGWRAWLPTGSGLGLSAAIGLVVLGVGALPLRPIGVPYIDRSMALLDIPWSTPAAVASLAVQVLAVAWWRSAPTTAFAVATVAAIVTGSFGGSNAIVETSWMFLVYALAVGAPPRRSGVVAAVGTLAVLGAYLSVPVMRAEIGADAAGIAVAYLVVPFLWFAGVRRRAHRLHAEQLRRERHEAERHEALEEERLQVARELHDVVAHHVSAIAVQAGAARITSDPEARREAWEHIAASGARIAEALPELESLTPDPGGVALTVDGVEELVAPVRAAGVPVTCEVRGDPGPAAGDPELFAQRILTEALTNVVRHAGASATRVLVEHGADAVTVQVADTGPASGHRAYRHGSGLGTAGMRERARMLGGTVEAGPVDGGWRVHALLPRPGVAASGLLLREDEGAVSISSATTTRPAPGAA
ncbi:histidine kinase [Pseudonocardia endophytica]|uniref:histidine kinase n=1 Tax=Pseudonocardia endophytica TaxID=401976 RepID=A0A4R1HPX3_PSEEN|nr:histidine kinase [Pseudonocardia endophytica]TCK22735.1 signal transduction histidine kinase [Pseudonocardia endophytica]